jgi:hypothetical protein
MPSSVASRKFGGALSVVLLVNVASVERVIYAIFQQFNQQWQNHTLRLFKQRA